jgi:ubiquinone/menaquinone biosynthesis C-methylase UbiE
MGPINYREHFKKTAADYDRTTQSRHITLIYELEKEVLNGLLLRINSREKTVMDFACGTGRWTQVLEDHFKEVTGVDVSSEMIALARQKCKKAEFIVTDITSDMVDKKLENRQFDVITAFRFYKNAEQELRQAATEAVPKYLKKNGLFIFDLHLNTFSFMGILASIIRFLKVRKILGVSTLTVRTISLGDIKRLFENSPFEIIDYYGTGLLPGRSDYTILPANLLYRVETFFTKRRILRSFSYNILVVARRK